MSILAAIGLILFLVTLLFTVAICLAAKKEAGPNRAVDDRSGQVFKSAIVNRKS